MSASFRDVPGLSLDTGEVLPPTAAAPSMRAAPSPTSAAIDFDAALNPRALDMLRRLPGPNRPALVNRVIGLYLDDAPKRVAQMRAAVAAGDGEALRSAAHSMKSSSASVGAERLAALCQALESQGRGGSVATAWPLLDSAQAELQRVAAALGRIVAGRS